MFLSHQDIKSCIKNGSIKIGPNFNNKNIRPAGVRVHLGKKILIPESGQTINLTEEIDLKYKTVNISNTEFHLKPGDFVLGSTFETFKTAPTILTILDGRSTIARLGLTVHITASIIDGTFEIPHAAILEIKNVGNFTIRLKFMDPIAMMLFTELKSPVTKGLQSQYLNMADKVAPPNLNFKTGEDK